MFRETHARWVCTFTMACIGIVFSACQVVAAEPEAQLLATLQNPKASFFDKTIACKQLAVAGTEAAIPVLVDLLDDEKLSHYARYGLEPNPSPEVDRAFLEALSTLKGHHLVGLIQSIANRGKPEAIDALAARLRDTDPTVSGAAAHAIARIGTAKAATILSTAQSADIAPAVLLAGKTLAKQGHKAQAIDLLNKLAAKEGVPQHVRTAAILQTIDLQGEEGLKTLASVLSSSDPDLFATGLRAARLLPVTKAGQTVLGALKDAPPAHAALLLTLLGDLAQPASLPAVVEAVKSREEVVRVAALEALATLGGTDQVLLLMDAARDPSEAVALQAQKSLAALPGAAVDQLVLDLLDDPLRQLVSIQTVGRRRLTAAVPKLLPLMDGPNQLAVIAALGETVSLAQLHVLGKLLGSESPALREAVWKALHAACYRMPNRDATAEQLAGYLEGASKETVAFIMGELRRLGGDEALATVADAARSEDDTLQNYATDALGKWLDVAAGPVLLELARTKGKTKYGIRCMRGYIRLIRQFAMPDEVRIAMCREALNAAPARRREEAGSSMQ